MAGAMSVAHDEIGKMAAFLPSLAKGTMAGSGPASLPIWAKNNMNRRVRVIDRRRLLAEDSPDEWRSRSDNTWVKICCFFVLFVVPLVVCNFFLTAYVLYIRSPDGGSITELDTIPELKITPASIPNLRQPPSVLIPEAPSEVAVPVLMNTTHRPAYRPPPSLTERPNVCSSILCRFAAQYYRAKLDESLDPCKDFYKYVCSTFKGANNQYRLTELDMEYTTTSIVRILHIPSSNQKSYEKAAALFQTCVLFVKNRKPEKRGKYQCPTFY
ncbi:hypothetical protein HPB49_010625 [Dermacentor silvarum]|uniref:Uncharacterized protein n=1 Tax=Dermacentor silvarum TaxID=543639 RepID=A0ACB8D4Q9_DERSI|nr:hypothetical protein HPB49_010625 [Dermacentor silvarum]